MSKFYFGSETSSTPSSPTAANDDEDDLPYPQPLPRSSFLAPDFDPTVFLSTHAHNRHQTLEDLRTELRQRSQDLASELLKLVNAEYKDFLSLGASMRGGGEKVEEVRVGVLAFRGGVEEVRGRVEGRRREVKGLLDGRRRVRGEIWVGRGLLEIERRVGELEGRLMLGSLPGKKSAQGGLEEEDGNDDEEDEGDDSSDSDEGEDEEDTGPSTLTSPTRLHNLTTSYLSILHLITRYSVTTHPFITTQINPRILRVKNTLLLDLASALKEAHTNTRTTTLSSGQKPRATRRLMKVLSIYRELGEGREAVKVLNEERRL